MVHLSFRIKLRTLNEKRSCTQTIPILYNDLLGKGPMIGR